MKEIRAQAMVDASKCSGCTSITFQQSNYLKKHGQSQISSSDVQQAHH